MAPYFCGRLFVPNRSIIYIDGLNLYYSARRYFGGPKSKGWKWLDVERYFRLIRQDDDIQVIKYFTSLVRGPSQGNQKPFLAALKTLPKVEVVYGKFKDKTVTRWITLCGGSIANHLIIKTVEEKRTDVSIALHMVCDAIDNKCDRSVLVSGDTDLVPALERIKERSPSKEICLYVPSGTAPHLRVQREAEELWALADKPAYLNMALMQKCQLPATLTGTLGKSVQKPSDW